MREYSKPKEGINIHLEATKIPNHHLDLFNSTELEFDGLSQNSAIVTEITTIFREKEN